MAKLYFSKDLPPRSQELMHLFNRNSVLSGSVKMDFRFCQVRGVQWFHGLTFSAEGSMDKPVRALAHGELTFSRNTH